MGPAPPAPSGQGYRAAVRRFLVGLSLVGLVAFVVCALPGLYVWMAGVHWPGYVPLLRLHVLAGEAAAWLALPATLAHLWATGSRPAKALLPFVIPLAALWFGLDRLALSHLAADGLLMPLASAGRAAGLAAIAVTAVAGFVQVLPRLGRPTPPRWSGIALAIAGFAAAALGWESMDVRGDVRWGAVVAHSAVGVAATALLLPHLRAVRRHIESGRGLALAIVGATLLALSWAWSIDAGYFSGFQDRGIAARWRTVTLPANAAERRVGLAQPFAAEHLDRSASCGVAGCHPEVTAQWQGSAHRFAADNAFYRAAVAQLVTERGAAEAGFCANCHDPERVLAGTVASAYAEGSPPPSDGVSCIACHAAWDAPTPEANGVVSFREPHVYPGATEAERNAAILLDPRLHRQDMQSQRHGMSDEGCGACHRVSLGPDMGAHAVAVVQDPFVPGELREEEPLISCNLCHMPVRTRQEGGRMPLYDHLWSGVNVDLAAYATHPERDAAAIARNARATADFVSGGMGVEHLPGQLQENVEFAEYARRQGSGLLRVDVQGSVVRKASSTLLELTVGTANHRAGHAFPIGPFDLQQVWLEVIVSSGGAELTRLGALVDQRIPVDAPRLGAVELGSDGEPLQKHRIWDVAGLRDKRVVPAGETVEDRLLLTLPALGRDAPLDVVARWRFRRVNPDFAAWALGRPDAIEDFAVITVGEGSATLR